jgi:hypothetical protein
MKNIWDVLRIKEQEITRIKKELDALRIAERLLTEDSDGKTQNSRVLAMPDSDDLLDLTVREQPTA